MVIWYLESSENWQTRNSWSWGTFRSWSYESSLTPGVVQCCFIEFNATRQSYLVMAEAGVKSRIHRYRIGFCLYFLIVYYHTHTIYIWLSPKTKFRVYDYWILVNIPMLFSKILRRYLGGGDIMLMLCYLRNVDR